MSGIVVASLGRVAPSKGFATGVVPPNVQVSGTPKAKIRCSEKRSELASWRIATATTAQIRAAMCAEGLREVPAPTRGTHNIAASPRRTRQREGGEVPTYFSEISGSSSDP